MADSEYSAKIKIEENGAGKAVDSIGGIAKAFKSLGAAILGVRNIAAALFKTLGTVSFVIHGISLVVDGVKRIKEWLDSAKTAAWELMKSGQDGKFASALEKTAGKARYLAESLAESLANLKKMQQFGDAQRAGARSVDAANLNLEEQRALAGVTDNDRRAEISDSFALRRSEAAWRSASADAAAGGAAIDSQIAEVRRSDAMEAQHRQEAENRLDDVRFWINDGRLTDEERDKRIKLAEALEKEIAASKKRSEANAALLQDLNRQKLLLNAPVEAARVGYETEKQRVENAQAERERQRREQEKRQVEEFKEISARNKAQSEREEAREKIDALNDEQAKVKKSLSSDPETIRAQDRISAMGGFATAGAAALSGVSSRDKSYEELRKQNDLIKQQINELRKIVENTKESVATFG